MECKNCTTAGSSGYEVFVNCNNLKTVYIGDNVSTLPSYAFGRCTSLTSITIPDSVTSIGDYAFYMCRNLTSVTIKNGVTSIGKYVFWDCSSLESITIPDSVTSIGKYAFYNCTSLTSITIPDSVTSIGDSVFNGCSSLTSVTIENGVTLIEKALEGNKTKILLAGHPYVLHDGYMGGEIADILKKMGAVIYEDEGLLYIRCQERLLAADICTGPYPDFPTDLQSPLLVALCRAQGKSSLTERIFNGRLAVAEELNRMGAGIEVEGNCARTQGPRPLTGCSVTARELRGGAALVLAGVCAAGYSRVYNRRFIDRGYEDIVRDLKSLGADIGSET